MLFIVLTFKFSPIDRPHFLVFQGLNLLRKASALREEAQKLEMEGIQKIELAVVGSEVDGFYGVLKGAVSHTSSSSALPPSKKCHSAPTAIVFQLPPQEPEKVELKSLLLQQKERSRHQRPMHSQ